MAITDIVKPIFSLLGNRKRRHWFHDDVDYFELRDLGEKEFQQYGEVIVKRVSKLRGVQWVKINAPIGRAIVQYSPKADSKKLVEKIYQILDDIEKQLNVEAESFSGVFSDVPGESEKMHRIAVEMGADSLSMMMATVLKVVRSKPLPIEFDFASITALMDSSPRLRRILEERFDEETVDLGLNLTNSVAQALAQGPVSPAVDIVKRFLQVREMKARRECWLRREKHLIASRYVKRINPDDRPRPVPLPLGPVEKYTDRAWYASLGAFGIGMVTTRSFEKSAGALLGGVPKPAVLGREAFASQLTQILTKRNILVVEPDVLRLLDRINTFVIQGDLLEAGLFYPKRIFSLNRKRIEDLQVKVHELFDPHKPLSKVTKRSWRISPVQKNKKGVPSELAKEISKIDGELNPVLRIDYRGQLVGLVVLDKIKEKSVDHLLRSLKKANMNVIISTNHPERFKKFRVDRIVRAGDALNHEIRRLQRRRRVVALVGTGENSAWSAPDLGIGICRGDQQVPWEAHLICEDKLSDVSLIVDACHLTNETTKESVTLSLAAASVGFFLSSRGLERQTSSQVGIAVNVAALLSVANGLYAAQTLDIKQDKKFREQTVPINWHELSIHEVLAKVGSTQKRGLKQSQVEKRRPVMEEEPSAVSVLSKLFVDELNNPFTPVLAGGAGLSAVVGSLMDASIVLTVIGLNGIIGALQRYQTESAVANLTQKQNYSVHVVRDGKEKIVQAADLVVGDVLHMHAGEIVPADCRLLTASSLEVDESSLTGESIPIRKTPNPVKAVNVADRTCMLYEGTSIAAGECMSVVVAIGDETESRKALYMPGTPPKSGVEARLDDLTTFTLPVTLFSGAAVVASGMARGQPITDVLGAGVSLAVAAIPEGLPLLATVAQLAASKRLSERGIIAKNIRAIEALGRVDVICIDKTGTLTQGKIHLHSVSNGKSEMKAGELDESFKNILAVGLRSSPEPKNGRKLPHMTDRALIRGAGEMKILEKNGHSSWTRQHELPFGPARMYHAVVGKNQRGRYLSVKGSPEVLLAKCTQFYQRGKVVNLTSVGRKKLLSKSLDLASKGLRILAVAEKKCTHNGKLSDKHVDKLTFHGFVAFSDPVRESAAMAVNQMQSAGVDIVMLTGDHPNTAKQIAHELNILGNKEVITGSEIDVLDDKQLVKRLAKVSVFARVTPVHKGRIVQAFQRMGRHVAMTGDGANDAAAIRLADVGIAVSKRSTAAARDAADLIVTDDRIETIVDAVFEGRSLWASVRDAVAILVGGNLGEIGFTLILGLLSGDSPLDARQLLLVNLLTDVAPALAIASKRPDKNNRDLLLHEGPEESLGKALNADIIWRAITTSTGAGAAWGLSRLLGSPERARTIGLLALVGTQLGQTVMAGNHSKSVLGAGFGSMAALAGIVQTPGLSQFFGCTPLGPVGWSIATSTSVAATMASSLVPKFFPSIMDKLGEIDFQKILQTTLKSNGSAPVHKRRVPSIYAPVI